jgi:heme A synthase
MAMPDFIAIAVLASIVLLPLALRRAGRPIHTLFDLPKSVGMRRFCIAALAAQVLAAVASLLAEPRLLGAPIHNWATLVFLAYLWTKAISLVRDARPAPPASPLP